jgi:uncharacterized protein YgiM (DUF1202 family)
MRSVSKVIRVGLLSVLALVLTYGFSLAANPGEAWVVAVDQPENCLRIRNGPGTNFDMVGCAERGTRLRLTGNRSANNWAEIDRPVRGWVWGPQISGTKVVYRSSGPVVTYVEPAPAVSTYVYDGPYLGSYPYYRSYRYRPYRSGFYYGGPGVAVGVGPRGGVAVRAGGVGVRVGPRGGVGVRIR